MSNIVFYAVCNDGVRKSEDILNINEDTSTLFFVKETFKYAYSYGSFYNWQVVDRDGNDTEFTLGGYTLKRFYNSGQQTDHRLVIEFENEEGKKYERVFHHDRRYAMHPDYMRHPESLWANDWDYDTACIIARDTMQRLESISAEDLLEADQLRCDLFRAKRELTLNSQEIEELHNRINWFKDTVTKVEIPDGIEEIPYNQYEGCYRLKEAVIPDSVRHIGVCAFNYCPELRSIRLESEIPPHSINKFPETSENNCTATVFVPKESIESYNDDTNWWGHLNPKIKIEPIV